MKKILFAAAAMMMPVTMSGAAMADTTKTGIYQVSEIYIIPTAMKGGSVSEMFHTMLGAVKAEPGLIQVMITQQIGQPYNYTVIEQWKDQAALDAHSATSEAKQFTQDLQPVISGPVYQRVFSVFQ
jgi:quinol monooxygenase YgiN